jgi:hypothetical protein
MARAGMLGVRHGPGRESEAYGSDMDTFVPEHSGRQAFCGSYPACMEVTGTGRSFSDICSRYRKPGFCPLAGSAEA